MWINGFCNKKRHLYSYFIKLKKSNKTFDNNQNIEDIENNANFYENRNNVENIKME